MSARASAEQTLHEATVAFLGKDARVTFAPTSGGVNNVVQYVTTADGQKFVLRCYNNGNNTARVRFEHAVLSAVRALGPLSFALPEALPSLSGETTVPLANGAQACLFTLIPGTLPKLSAVKSIGAASGELSTALARVSVVMASPTAPYHDLYAVHHAVSQDSFFKAMAASDFDGVRTASDYLVAEVKAIEASIDACKRLQLPEQLIHGDLHYDNVLCVDGRVSGLLDFEFCAMDFRAMELAICLSKYVGEPSPLPYLEQFIEGYASKAQLTVAEIEALPELINLRVLSNVVYFVGRAAAGEDSISSLVTRAETYANRVKWVRANADVLRDLLRRFIKP